MAGLSSTDPVWLFGGGLVLVEATNSTWVREAVGCPGDHSDELAPGARALLRQVGHSGSYHNPMLTVEAGPRRDPSRPFARKVCVGTLCTDASDVAAAAVGGGFRAFQLQALELRRVLAEAIVHGEPFALSYRRGRGDYSSSSSSSSSAADSRPLLTVAWDGGSTSPLRCTQQQQEGGQEDEAAGRAATTSKKHGGGGRPGSRATTDCRAGEEGMVAPLDWAERLALRFLVSNPYPLNAAGDQSTELHCFGP